MGAHGRRAKIEEPVVAVGEDAAVDPHRLDRQRGLDAERVDGLSARAAVARVLEDAAVAGAEDDALARLRGDLAGREELSLARAPNDDRQDARARGVEAVAVRAADVRVDLGERAGGDLDALAFDGRREPRPERAVEFAQTPAIDRRSERAGAARSAACRPRARARPRGARRAARRSRRGRGRARTHGGKGRRSARSASTRPRSCCCHPQSGARPERRRGLRPRDRQRYPRRVRRGRRRRRPRPRRRFSLYVGGRRL